jgi:CheY-like chemotaxis protein
LIIVVEAGTIARSSGGGGEGTLKVGRILLIDEDQAATRATRRSLAALGHTLVAVEPDIERALGAVEEYAPDVLLIDARSCGERASVQLARHAHTQFGTPSVLRATPRKTAARSGRKSPQRRAAQSDEDSAILRVRGNDELAGALQLSLLRGALEREQKRAAEQGARANQAEAGLRTTARLVHQLNNLLSAIRCNAFLIQSDARDRPELYEAARDTTTAVERCAEVMAQLSVVVREHGEPMVPSAAELRAKLNGYPRQRTARSRSERSVLVVDDDPVVHRAVTRFLTSRGYRILAAATPGEALFIAQHEQIDVVISDLIMPEMTGYDLAARIKRLHPSARVIYMSGYAPGTLGAFAAGIHDLHDLHDSHDSQRSSDPSRNSAATLLQKPFAVETLLRVLSAALAETDTPAEQVTARIANASNEP